MDQQYDFWYPANLIDLKKFIRSRSMEEYLEQETVSYHSLPQIIVYSLNSIDDKEQALRKLMEVSKDFPKKELYNECEIYLNLLIQAKEYLEAPGVFVTYTCEYDGEKAENHFLKGLFARYDEVIDFINHDFEVMAQYDEEPESNYYHMAYKYLRDESDKYTQVSTCYFLNGVLVYIDMSGRGGHSLSIFDGTNLNLKVPFKPGDIVEIDNSPFGDKYKAIILDIGDNIDCCSVTAMCKNVDGTWHAGALKHGMLKFLGTSVLQISPLYTAEIYEGDSFDEDEALFPEIQKYIRENYPEGDELLYGGYRIYEDVLKNFVGD